MDTVRFIADSLRQVQLRLLGSCEGLTQEQVSWRPTPHANSIGFILWHVARSEESLTLALRGGRPELWVSEGWHRKFGQPVDSPDPGDRMGLRSLPIPGLETLVGYLEAVHDRTQELLSGLTPDRLETTRDPILPERTLGTCLRHLITHKNNHHGQIDYIRGLQEETWDLPRGTGVVLTPPE